MKKALLLGAPLLLVVPMLMLMLGMGNANIEAVNDCRTQQDQGQAGLTGLGDVGEIDGPVGGPVTGTVGLTQANIPNRSGIAGFQTSMRTVVNTGPDIVTLNEVSARSVATIEAAAPGYAAFRAPSASGPGAAQAKGNVVLWRTDTWTRRNAGRIKIVEDDRALFHGRRVVWDRFATWVLLERKRDGAVLAVVSVHHMTNPARFPGQHGNPPLTRAEQYGAGMDRLLQLRSALARHGPVLIGGDMNTGSAEADKTWSAIAKMMAAGYGWHHHGVDFAFFSRHRGARLQRGWSGPMASDHDWVAARVAMNGIGPEPTANTAHAAGTAAVAATGTTTTSGTAPIGDVAARLRRVELSTGSRMSPEQARNAIAIAQVAREVGVPRFGLEIALATALQESGLRNLPGGHADSMGLFQQRPSAGWGTRTQISAPGLAARAFFGRAAHTSNTGLLDVPNWSTMTLTEAAQAVQASAYPDAYARWNEPAVTIAGILGGDLPTHAPADAASGCLQPVSTSGCVAGTGRYDLGPVKPELARMVNRVGPRFDIATVGGYRESARDPGGHPSGYAADFMVPTTPTGRTRGDSLAAYAREHARELGIDYIIWWQRIWSLDRATEGWRPLPDRGGSTENHRDHVHINVKPNPDSDPVSTGDSGCGDVVYPVPGQYQDNDARNWHEDSDLRSSWHTGTDFAAPCGTPVYAAHAGTVQVDTTHSWAGTWLVKVSTGPGSVSTWYAHLQDLSVSRGEEVAPGQPIGTVGNEGNSYGCHLHFEVHLQGGIGGIYGPDNVDPSRWLEQNTTGST